jgi:hypothetical protein
MKDYIEVEKELLKIAHKFQPNCTTQGSPFKGQNFITNYIVTRRKLKNGVWFELSYGTGMLNNNYLLGVTLINKKGESLKDIQGCFHSLFEVEECLEKASKIN